MPNELTAEELVKLYTEPQKSMVYDAEVGDFVSTQKAAARNAIRSQRANLAAQRSIYGMSPGYMSLSMREDKGPFSYMGDMPPTVRPPDDYGSAETTEDKFYRLAKEGASQVAYGIPAALTGGLIGEATARNVKGVYDAVSSADLEPYAKQVKALIEQYGRDPTGDRPIPGMRHIYGPAFDVEGTPVIFKHRDPDSPEHLLSKQYPDVMAQSAPVYFNTKFGSRSGLVSEKLTPLENLSLSELEVVIRNNFTPKAADALMNEVRKELAEGFVSNVLLSPLGDTLRLRTADSEQAKDILFGSAGLRLGRSTRTEDMNIDDINLVKALAGDPLFDRFAYITEKENLMPEDTFRLANVGTDAQGRIKMLDIEPMAKKGLGKPSSHKFKAPDNPLVDELQQLPPLKSDPIKTTPPRSIPSGTLKGMGAGIAGEAAYAALQESTSIPAAYVKEQVAKLQGGGYIPDFSELPEIEKPAAYSNAIGLLSFGLPKGYFGSEQHKQEERLSKRFGAPLTEEVKVARDMMKLTMEMQNQKVIRASDPSLVDQFKDFGLTLVESEAAAALAALL